MAKNVESRVVEMKFDNKQFEDNAKETINTLNELKRILDESTSTEFFDSIDRAANNVDLSGIQSGIDTLTDRFSTMGIVGMRVIENITDAITGKLTSSLRTVIDSITEGGLKRAQNIENAKFQLAGMLEDEKDLEIVLKNVNDAVAGTAYSYDAAANAASQFAASGIKAGDQMLNTLKAISGVAAVTNSSYEDIARIFTQAAGNGRLMGDQLLQLSVRGLNAASTLAKYFNGVREGSIIASDAVKDLITSLVGATNAMESASGEDIFAQATEELEREYKLRQKAYKEDLKNIQNMFNQEYNAKKKSYDESYKLLQKSLNAEITEIQKANNKRIEESNQAYQANVEAYRKATNERINLINEEYTESIKLIDEERYNKIKAIDEKIKGINDEAKAEQKARELAEEEEQRSLLKRAVEEAKFAYTREKAEKALAEFEEEVARKRLNEQRQDTIDQLNEEKSKINDEAQLKKEEAAKKRQSAIEQVQEESQAKLEAMQKAHQAELEALREQQQENLEAVRETNAARLEALREQQSAELAVLKESQNEQIEAKRETQSEALADLKKSNKEQLEALKETLAEEGLMTSKFATDLEITEADIRKMVSNGLISFDLFSEAMNTTFADHAFKANDTFQGVMSNIRSALAKTGALFYQPFLETGQDNPMIAFLNAIMKTLNQVKTTLEPVAKEFTSFVLKIFPPLTDMVWDLFHALGGVDDETKEVNEEFTAISPLGKAIGNIFKMVGDVFQALISVIKPVIDAFKEVFSISTDNFIKGVDGIKEFTESLKLSEKAADAVKKAFKGVFSILKLLKTVISTVFRVFSPLTRLFGTGARDAANFGGSIGDIVSAFADWLEESEAVNAVINTMSGTIGWFVDKVLALANLIGGKLKDAFKDVEDIGAYFSEGFLNGVIGFSGAVLNGIKNFALSILDKLREVFGIHSPARETKVVGEQFGQGFISGILSIAGEIFSTINGVFSQIIVDLKDFFGSIDYTELISNAFNAATDFIDTMVSTISDGIPKIVDGIAGIFIAVADWFTNNKPGFDTGVSFITQIVDGMVSVFWKLIDGFATIFANLSDAIRPYIENFSIQEAFEAGKRFSTNFATSLIETIKKWFGPIGEAFGQIFTEVDPGTLMALGIGVGILWSIWKLAKALNVAIGPMDAFTGALKSFGDAIKAFVIDTKVNALLKVSIAISILVGAIGFLYVAFGEDINVAKLAAVALTVTAVATVLGILFAAMGKLSAASSKAYNNIVKASNNLETGIGYFAKSIGKSAKAWARAKAFKTIIKGISGAMLDIAISIAILVSQYQKEGGKEAYAKAERTFMAFAFITAALVTTFMLVSSTLSKAKTDNIKNMGIAALAITGGLLLTVFAISKILTMDFSWKRDIGKLLLLATLFGMVLIVVRSLTKTNNALQKNEGMLKAGLVIAFCVLLWETVHELKKLIKMGASISKNRRQLVLLAAIIGMVLIVVAALSKVSNSIKNKDGLKMGGTLLGFTAMLIVCTAAIGILSHMKLKNYLKGLLMVGGILATLYVLCQAAGKIESSDGYKSILAMAAVIGVLTVAMAALTMIPFAKLAGSALSLSAVLLAFSDALRSAAKANDLKSAVNIIAMIFTVIVIGLIMKGLSDIPWQNLLATATSISEVMVAMSGAMRNIVTTETTWKQIGESAVIIFEGLLMMLAMAGILVAISNSTDGLNALAAATAISESMVAMSGAMRNIVTTETTWKQIGESAVIIFEGIIMMAAIGAILKVVSQGDLDKGAVIAMATSIAGSMLAMAAAMKIVNSTETTWKQIGESAVIIVEGLGSMWAIAWGLRRYSSGTDWKQVIGMAVGISVMLIGLAVVAKVASWVGVAWKEALAGLLVLDAAIANFVAIVEALGWLYEKKTFRDLFESGGDFLVNVAEIIGRFVGALVEGALTESSNALPVIGSNLSAFMTNAKEFFDGLDTIDKDMVKHAGYLAEIILAISTAQFIQGVGDILGLFVGKIPGKMGAEKFANQLVAFGRGIKEFADVTDGIKDSKKFKDVAEATASIVDVASVIPNSGGVLGDLFGNNDIDDFGDMLAHFISKMVDISNNLKDVDNTNLRKFKPISEAMSYIINVATTLPNSGGWLGGVVGENDIDDFGRKLFIFSNYLRLIAVNFASVSEAGLNKVPTVADALGALAKAAKKIPNSGGFIKKIFGDNDVDDFGQKLLTFSTYLVSICNTIGGVNLNKPLTILGKSIELVRKVSRHLRIAFHNYKFIGDKMEDLVTDLSLYSGLMAKINNDIKVDPSKRLEDLESSISKVTDIKGKFETDFKSYKKVKVKEICEDVGLYASLLTDIFNKQYAFVNEDAIDNLYLTMGNMKDIVNYIKSFFSDYKTSKIKEISDDLALYIDCLIKLPNENTLTNTKSALKIIESTQEIISNISNTFKEVGKYRSGKVDDFMGDVTEYSDVLVSIASKNFSNILNKLIIIQATIQYAKTISDKFKEIFGSYYSVVGFDEFAKDLKTYAGILQFVIGCGITEKTQWDMYYITLTQKYADKIKEWFEYSFKKYTAIGFDDFMSDLKAYVGILTYVNEQGFSYQNQWDLYYITLTQTYADKIKEWFEYSFKKYAAGKLEQFITDLRSYVDLISYISKLDLNNKNPFETIDELGSVMTNVKSKMEELGLYSTPVGFNDFLYDMQRYAGTFAEIAKVDFSDFDIKMESLATATSRFLNLMPQFAAFNATNFINFLKDLKKQGTDGIKEFLSEFNNAQINVVKAVSVFFGYITSAITSKKELMTSAGRIIIGYIADGMSDRQNNERIHTAILNMMLSIVNQIINSKNPEIAGINFVRGFVRGIEDNFDKASNAGKRLAHEALEAARRELNERSPSKEMMKIGSYAGEGFVEGLSSWVDAVTDVGTRFGDNALDTMKDAMSRITNEIHNDVDFNPVITPFLDLTSIEENAKVIGSMLNFDKPIELAANAGISFAGGINDILEHIQETIPDNSNEDVVDAINSLRSDMNVMNQKLTNLQVVMDSGELVGVLADPIDRQIGYNAIMAERGVR